MNHLQRKYHFLVVDDEVPIVKLLSDILALHPNTGAVYSAGDGERALAIIREHPVDILITDILMPRLSGIELIQAVRKQGRDIHIIAVSASGKADLIREAVRNGVYDYVLKPFTVDEIMFSVNRVIDRLRLLEERADYVARLESRVREVTDKLQESVYESFLTILNSLEARNKAVFEHSRQVALFSEKMASLAGESSESAAHCKIGGMFHDIGKIGLPDRILLSTGDFSEQDTALMRTHPEAGRRILSPIFHDRKDILDFILYHHERWDGQGYPAGLKGNAIPRIARIAAVVNSYAAMTGPSLYRKPLSREAALDEIRQCAGKQFDPELAALFVEKAAG